MRACVSSRLRDVVVWLQLQHRTLWVAKYGGCENEGCTARGCTATENMTHLLDCEVIQREIWKPILRVMIEVGLQYKQSRTFWIAGQIVGEDGDRKAVCGETASFICWAWRCLYAEVIHARIYDTAAKHEKRCLEDNQDGKQQSEGAWSQVEEVV